MPDHQETRPSLVLRLMALDARLPPDKLCLRPFRQAVVPIGPNKPGEDQRDGEHRERDNQSAASLANCRISRRCSGRARSLRSRSRLLGSQFTIHAVAAAEKLQDISARHLMIGGGYDSPIVGVILRLTWLPIA